MRRKLAIFTGTLLLALVLSTGAFAYTYTFDSITLNVSAAGGEIATSEPASGQPAWEDMVPQTDMEYEILTPDGNGSYTSIPYQHPMSGEHWDKVTSDDGYDSYVSTWLSPHFKTDVYSISDPEEGQGEINSVIVYFKFAGHEDGFIRNAYGKAAIYTHGEVFTGPTDMTTGGDFINGMHQWTANPATGEPWTWSEVEDLEAGVSLKGHNPVWPAYCTFVSAWVEYVVPPPLEGEAPAGNLFVVTPHPEYTGDLSVNLYLTSTAELRKAFRYLNLKVYMANTLEAEQDPSYQMLTLENGVASFNIVGGAAANYTIEVLGGSYGLISGDPDEWSEGWSVTPEFYCEVTHR